MMSRFSSVTLPLEVLLTVETAINVLSHVERTVRPKGLPRSGYEPAAPRAVDAPAALDVRVILHREDELVLERQGVEGAQVLLSGAVLVVQFENQTVAVDAAHTALPLAAGGRLVVVVEHLELDVPQPTDEVRPPVPVGAENFPPFRLLGRYELERLGEIAVQVGTEAHEVAWHDEHAHGRRGLAHAVALVDCAAPAVVGNDGEALHVKPLRPGLAGEGQPQPVAQLEANRLALEFLEGSRERHLRHRPLGRSAAPDGLEPRHRCQAPPGPS